ncbi:hypothetical protein V8F20_002360 [Naviculisporaceae sp. PSN 640]
MGGGKTQVPKKYQPPRRQQPSKTPTSKPQVNTTTSHAHLTVPINWPSEIPFLKAPSYSKFVKPSQLEIIRRPPPPPAAADPALGPPVVGENGIIPLDFPIGPNASVQIQRITDPNHPAYGQCGLFAARDLLPGELILPYYGVVHVGTGSTSKSEDDSLSGLDKNLEKLSLSQGPTPDSEEKTEKEKEKETERLQHEKSDYDLWLSREADLAVDGEMMGNEARFVNDYRGVPGKERENAELRFVWDERIVHRVPSATPSTGVDGGSSEEGKTNESKPGEGESEIRRGEWTMAVYVLPLGKKARQKVLEAQAKAEELQKKKLQQAQKKNAGGSGAKKAAVGGTVPAVGGVTTTKVSSVGVIKKGEEILVSYGRGFWDRRRQEGHGVAT